MDEEFEKAILKASVNIRNENKSKGSIHISTKDDLDSYILSEKLDQIAPEQSELWCPEFDECIGEVLEAGAKKYAPRDWEQPDGYSMGYKAQCDAIFHHLAREFVYKENYNM